MLTKILKYFQGVICQIFVVDGTVSVGDQIQSHHTGKSYEVKNIAYLSPDERPVQKLQVYSRNT